MATYIDQNQLCQFRVNV